jgi:hypothetical protein
VHIESLKLSFFPLTLLLFLFFSALFLSLLPLFLSLLHLFNLLLALLLSLLLLFLPLTLLFFTLNHSLLNTLHPFDLLDFDKLFLISEQPLVEFLSVLIFALTHLLNLSAEIVSLSVDLIKHLLYLFFVLLGLVLRLFQFFNTLAEVINLWLKLT